MKDVLLESIELFKPKTLTEDSGDVAITFNTGDFLTTINGYWPKDAKVNKDLENMVKDSLLANWHKVFALVKASLHQEWGKDLAALGMKVK